MNVFLAYVAASFLPRDAYQRKCIARYVLRDGL